MKILILVISVLSAFTMGSEVKQQTKKLDISVADVDQMLTAFLRGIKIDQISDATIPCKLSFNSFVRDTIDATENFMNSEVLDGALGVADVLAISGPIARNCTRSVDELMAHLHNYVHSFDSFLIWISQTSWNVMFHFDKLFLITTDIVAESNQSPINLTTISGLMGELVFYTLNTDVITPKLNYRRGDPLAPSPMNEILWITLESIYEFLAATQVVEESIIGNCQGNILNMVLFQNDAFNNFQADNLHESLLLTFDSFVFLRPTIETCDVAGQQIYQNATVVFEKIRADPHTIRENFENNIFHTVSGSIAAHAQIYHGDVISLSRVMGGVVYRTLVTSTS